MGTLCISVPAPNSGGLVPRDLRPRTWRPLSTTTIPSHHCRPSYSMLSAAVPGVNRIRRVRPGGQREVRRLWETFRPGLLRHPTNTSAVRLQPPVSAADAAGESITARSSLAVYRQEAVRRSLIQSKAAASSTC